MKIFKTTITFVQSKATKFKIPKKNTTLETLTAIEEITRDQQEILYLEGYTFKSQIIPNINQESFFIIEVFYKGKPLGYLK